MNRLSSAPRNPDLHLFDTELGPHLFLVNGSEVYGIGAAEHERLERALLGPEAAEEIPGLLREFALWDKPRIGDEPLTSPPLRALSLAVAQTCNLGCTYCYAQQGDFGGPAKAMPLDVARAAIDRLLAEAGPGDRVNLAFMGGEPLVNRRVVREATDYAAVQARERGVAMSFSITTNGTLIEESDAEFFEQHGFAVTISLDGANETNDRLRPFKDGRGSYARILERVAPCLARQQRMQVSARVTVTPRNLELPETLRTFVDLGFHSVGFSPMLSAPSGQDTMGKDDLAIFLEQMIECGRAFEEETIAGRRYPFANLATALREIHRGTHRPYPCGAGAGYMGVSAEGDLSACHRFVRDPAGAMGNLTDGRDETRQNEWLRERHVHRQEPCRSCWARYLCGGGCHHEVIHRGRPACDYIRGWLHWCLGAYVRLLAARPDFFESVPEHSAN
ncbi:MAG TPA: radical SAM protein [Chthoniobacteraceae bacterium]|jgi:uncharacterized protein|nr:radical SAM protein [Chthoniobacteraceae bacterium]